MNDGLGSCQHAMFTHAPLVEGWIPETVSLGRWAGSYAFVGEVYLDLVCLLRCWEKRRALLWVFRSIMLVSMDVPMVVPRTLWLSASALRFRLMML
jgi:hypothetical protein